MTHATRMRRSTLTLLVATLGIAPLACAPRQSLALRPGVAPRPWDAYSNAGRLRVHDAPDDAAGPRLYRALARRAELEELFDRHGEPDALEVNGRGGRMQRVVLLYWRRGVGRPRRIVLDATQTGFVASAVQPLPRTRKTVRDERPPSADAATEASADRSDDLLAPPSEGSPSSGGAARPQPNPTERLECPIDRDRPDCRAYCDAGVSYEWCR